jgi:hypothetical protein
MKSEPTAIIEAVRALALIAATFGIAITAQDQAALVAVIGAGLIIASTALAWWNRRQVYAKDTVQAIANEATYLPPGTPVDIGEPPKGN